VASPSLLRYTGERHPRRPLLGFALAADLPFSVLMSLFYLSRRDLLANGLAHSAGLVIMIGLP